MRCLRLLILVSLFVLPASGALGQGQIGIGKTNKPTAPSIVGNGSNFDFFGGVTIMSDSRGQGFTSSSEAPTISADVGVVWGQFYAGISGSHVDFGHAVDLNGVSHEVAHIEISYYAGYVGVFDKYDYDVGISYTTLPNAYDPGGEFDYFEANFGVSRVVHDDWRAGIRIYFSPEFSGEQGVNWVFEGSVEKPLRSIAGLQPTFTAVVGYQEGDEGKGNFDYWFWNAGVEVKINDTFSFDLRYHDTADVPFPCTGLCDAAFVASASVDF